MVTLGVPRYFALTRQGDEVTSASPPRHHPLVGDGDGEAPVRNWRMHPSYRSLGLGTTQRPGAPVTHLTSDWQNRGRVNCGSSFRGAPVRFFACFRMCSSSFGGLLGGFSRALHCHTSRGNRRPAVCLNCARRRPVGDPAWSAGVYSCSLYSLLVGIRHCGYGEAFHTSLLSTLG